MTTVGALFLMVQEGALGLFIILRYILGVVLYGGLYFGLVALMTLIYNLFAGKFGGVVMTIRETDEI
ncbi:hypothetical protein [Natribacillus halophilus]|uniref:hypothetical protein n=1 Tax=Natribacillus halophilus TaxID=549003 RepID=UPI000B84E457|nr:hypothetical protein [Natribacillus halophilus]